MEALNPIYRAAVQVQDWLLARGWRFCLIGGVAIQRWAEPRLTRDVDLTLLTGFGGEEAFADALLGQFSPRNPNAREHALRNRVLLLTTAEGVPVDVAFGAIPFEERCVARASWFQLGSSARLLTCGLEDLIVHKIFAGRDRDWDDLQSILRRQRGQLDLPLVRQEVCPLLELKESPEAWERFEHLVTKVRRQLSTPI